MGRLRSTAPSPCRPARTRSSARSAPPGWQRRELVVRESGAPPPAPLTLDLSAKTQELRKKVKFFATATAASTLIATGKAIKETTKQLAANEKTEIKAELARKFVNQAVEGDRVKIKGTATDQSGTAATDTVKVKVTDCPGRGQKADCTGR